MPVSLSPGVSALGRLAHYRSRYLVHGAVAVVGIAALTSIAVQPRPAPAIILDETPEASVPLEVDQAMLALDVPAAAPIDAVSAPADAPSSAPAEPEAAAPPPPKPSVHTVEEGETVAMLADRFGLSPETILAANGLRNPDLLKIGQDLVILPTDGVLYTLKNGETIRRVADRFGVDTMDIIKANDLGDPDVVQPGTQLMVPGATPVLPSARSVARASDTSSSSTSSSDQQAAVVGGGVGLPVEATANAVPSTRTYEVQPGDTLAGIAETFGVDVQTVLSSNGIDDPDTIKPGSELRILPVKGLEYTVQSDERLADIAWKYQVDLGLLLDYNDLNDPDVIRVGAKLVIPGGKLRAEAVPAPAAVSAPVAVEAPRVQPAAAAPAVVAAPAPAQKPVAAAPAPAAPPKPVAKPAPDPEPAASQLSVGGGGNTIVANAMKYLGYRYVFGGTSPSGFDCSGFVYYIHNHSGAPVGRGMWQQFNGGAHISIGNLQPGDTVFFANTYMAGLSHDGIYIGNGQFIHASDERTGVTISSINSSYWAGHFAGATRLWD